MTDRSIVKAIAIATLISGTLDILLAVILSSIYGKGPAAMLRGVASGPFPGAPEWGAAGSVLGLATHFTLMAIMVTVFMLAARRVPALTDNPWLWGLIYGLITYVKLRDLPVHDSMREVSVLIWESCKTYLFTQGKFLLIFLNGLSPRFGRGVEPVCVLAVPLV